MEFLSLFLLNVLSAAPRPEGTRGMIYVIIRQPYAYLEGVLRQAFEGRGDVKVIVDRRNLERRRRGQPIAIERRRAERRWVKEELLQVIIGELTGP